MTDTPRKYERRCRQLEVESVDGRRMWAVEHWYNCQCPDCEKEGHWMSLAIVQEEKTDRWLSERDLLYPFKEEA